MSSEMSLAYRPFLSCHFIPFQPVFIRVISVSLVFSSLYVKKLFCLCRISSVLLSCIFHTQTKETKASVTQPG